MPDDISSVILIGFIFVIVVVFIIYLTSLTVTSSPQVIGTPPIPCAPGQCATNLFNGEKSCPSNGQAFIDPSFQVCNSPTLCENPITPYALQDDGSTNTSGTCQPGVQCRCLREPQCADYIVSIFQSINGNPFVTLEGTHTAFTQTADGVNPNTGQLVSVPPIPYTDPLSTFCSVPLAFLNRSAPGCNFAAEMNFTSIIQCMARNEACLTGTLAFLAADPDTFSAANINSTPLACVRGTACPPGDVAVWNNALGAVVCKAI